MPITKKRLLLEEFEPDSRDIQIMEKLSKTSDGLGFNELQRETGFPRNTLTRHLKTLQKENVVIREQLGTLHNSPTKYKVIISDGLRAMAEMGLEIAINLDDIDFEKMTKVQLVSMIPHLMTGIAIYQTIWMDDYITNQISKIEFRFALKLIANFIEELKETFSHLLNERDYARLEDETWTVYVHESSRAAHITFWAKDYTKKYRTVNEIVRDEESLFAMTGSNGHYSGGGEKIQQQRYEIEKDPKKRIELKKIEENYEKVRNKLSLLQCQLKGAPGFQIKSDTGFKFPSKLRI